MIRLLMHWTAYFRQILRDIKRKGEMKLRTNKRQIFFKQFR